MDVPPKSPIACSVRRDCTERSRRHTRMRFQRTGSDRFHCAVVLSRAAPSPRTYLSGRTFDHSGRLHARYLASCCHRSVARSTCCSSALPLQCLKPRASPPTPISSLFLPESRLSGHTSGAHPHGRRSSSAPKQIVCLLRRAQHCNADVVRQNGAESCLQASRACHSSRIHIPARISSIHSTFMLGKPALNRLKP